VLQRKDVMDFYEEYNVSYRASYIAKEGLIAKHQRSESVENKDKKDIFHL